MTSTLAHRGTKLTDTDRANLIGDYQWLAQDGLHHDHISKRLGYTPTAMDRVLTESGHPREADEYNTINTRIEQLAATGRTFTAADVHHNARRAGQRLSRFRAEGLIVVVGRIRGDSSIQIWRGVA